MVKTRTIISIIYLVLVIFIFTQLGCKEQREEDLIIESLEKIADSAEDKEIDGVLTLISITYSDEQTRTKGDLRKVLENYLARYQGIVIHLLENRIPSLELPRAMVDVDVALSHGAAKMMRRLARMGTTFYRFHLSMEKEEKVWRVSEASWERVSVNELYPESRERINRIFPDVF